jgi:hypothetical protein
METTGGLVSAYQPLDYSAQKIAAYSLSVTNAEMISVKLISIPSLFKLPEEFLRGRGDFASTSLLDLGETVYSEVYETMIASERVLARDWNQPDEDEAWRGL